MSQPRHNKAKVFVEQRLFDSVTSFAELEDRISRLPTPNERGDAFEVFAEAYLATTRVVQAREVWPFDAIPLPVKQQLSLDTGIDMGVDGVLCSTVGEYSAYQVKFRSRRPSLTWDNLSTFMGLTDQVGQRVLFTNCDELPSLMNERSNFFCIRGSDLDPLTSDEFDKIAHWLRGEPAAAKKKHPLPHQDEALANILPALESHDRATAVMACGTGKTLVALWVAERLKSSKVLILVPSLALLRQTLHEWLKESSANELIYMCVCSDPTVDSQLDSVNIQQSDLDFPVTTDRQTVERFLSTPFDGAKMVFSTYQSAHVVAEAMRNEDVFDFGIFDEAHKTAGRIGVRFGFAVTNDNLPIKKRLFLTATPRHFDFQHKDKEGEAKAIYSMDAPEVYGPQCHTLSFAEAARRDIICPYKVVVSVVTSQMVNNERLRRGEVIINGDAVRARHVANQIAVQKAIEKYDATKVFTFHRSIKAAERFTSPETEGIATHLSGFDCFHVNGRIPSARRDTLMRSFAESPKAIVSNARCLTEGVDLPAVDMVAFLSPKRSWVDIVQATGRAMRKSPAKEFGYVLVPLFVEQQNEESVDDALARTTFQDIWDVLAAMLEQDDAFVETIQGMREERGRTGGFDDDSFRELIEVIGDEVSLDTIRRFVTVASVDRFGTSWDDRFGELMAYRDKHRHCYVPPRYTNNPQLAVWCRNNEQAKKNGTLSRERIRRLENLGYPWPNFQPTSDEMLDTLKDFGTRHGHYNIPADDRENTQLAKWLSNVRRRFRDGRLSAEKIVSLSHIGYSWEWEDCYSALVAYQEMHGNCEVPVNWPRNPQLSFWIREQCRQIGQGTLEDECVTKLRELGVFEECILWEEMFPVLGDFRRRHGHCYIQRESEKGTSALLQWARSQRFSYEAGTLKYSHKSRLESVGFFWDETWQKMFAELVAFHREHGHTDVSPNDGRNTNLTHWLAAVRLEAMYGSLPFSEKRSLDRLGFDWDQNWQEMFDELNEYAQEYDECSVLSSHVSHDALATWVDTQRTQAKAERLSHNCFQKLAGIGFSWDSNEEDAGGSRSELRWEEMLRQLAHHMGENGHCDLTEGEGQNPELTSWLAIQRRKYRNGTLRQREVRRLDDLKVEWDWRWESMFDELCQFRRVHGHCPVVKLPATHDLGMWVELQRSRFRLKDLRDDQIQRLTDIGFVWGCDTDAGGR